MKIDKIYCINLDRRPDRWETASNFFVEQGLKVERWSAVDGQKLELPYKVHKTYKAELGSLLSHLTLYKHILKNNYKNVLIMEDDAKSDFNILNRIDELLINKDLEFDMLYLGGNHIWPISQIDQFLFKITRTYTTHAYIINSRCLERIINYLDMKVNEIENSEQMIDKCVAIDVYLSNFHRELVCYVLKPHIVYQENGYSDIQEDNVNYSFLKD